MCTKEEKQIEAFKDVIEFWKQSDQFRKTLMLKFKIGCVPIAFENIRKFCDLRFCIRNFRIESIRRSFWSDVLGSDVFRFKTFDSELGVLGFKTLDVQVSNCLHQTAFHFGVNAMCMPSDHRPIACAAPSSSDSGAHAELYLMNWAHMCEMLRCRGPAILRRLCIRL